jgi:hypothetical protein
MEMFSSSFQTAISRLLLKIENQTDMMLVATVPAKPLGFSDQIKANKLSQTFTVRNYFTVD